MLNAAIGDTLYKYIAVRSYTASESENEATDFLSDVFSDISYFNDGPGKFGTYPIEGDPYGRSVFWALIRGEGSQTAIMIHHSDVVGTEDFSSLAHLAFSPDELKSALLEIKDSLSEEARRDLEDDTYIFGKGSCDMKAGGAIQIEIMKSLVAQAPLKGNLLMLAVPDEENLSAGMRAAVHLINILKKEYGLKPVVTINSEPHQRKDPNRGLFSTGSVGKAMPFFYVRGKLAHIGKVFEGIDPILIMSELVQRTELQPSLSDAIAGEVSPPPVWLGFRDRKDAYDVSIPLTAVGCMSMLTLGRPLAQIEKDIRKICEEVAASVVETIEARYEKHRELIDPASSAGTESLGDITSRDIALRGLAPALDAGPIAPIPLNNKILVSSISELIEEATKKGGETFKQEYSRRVTSGSTRNPNPNNEKNQPLAETVYALIDFIYENITDQTPRIIYGLLPPYYPATSDLYAPGNDGDTPQGRRNVPDVSFWAKSQNPVLDLPSHLQKYSKNILGVPYDTEHFYTGISDLSYAGYSKENWSESESILKKIMPLYGTTYNIPFKELSEIAMPVINIGPWGKDFHKLTERVLKKDTLTETPKLILEALRHLEII